ncbi:NAD(P)-dependent oxidoreductase [Frigoribacterium sp. RIT-PI-h]|uniref:NAD(P)-dependent oxidoreductase n=1 Tax=Frigoribacterium sp. RIT-PI-h TaxID=1690245 RepID=UPI0006CDEAE5|nr:NAD(P)-dependent oxidoreductase [Frigoribacterium sp. RIT-PI-h]KPG87720.1 3-hydroxyisobutyrate dehydrogenase [Frigoribacterium sp. RIT-PI-h]
MKVAVLGTGIMGQGVAGTLLREGFDVTVWNRTRSKAEPLAADGAVVADTARQAVEGVDVIVTVLFDGDAVLEVLDDAADASRPDAVWVQASTIGEADTARVVRAADGHGLRLVEAMMLGTKKPAATGKLVMLAAGDGALLETVRPVLDAMGSKTIVAGDTVGQGTALKLAANAWIATITAATAQSLALTETLGLDPQLFLDAIDGGQSDTPYAHLKGATMIAGEYPAQFALDGIRKDLGLMREAARGTRFDTGLLEALSGVYAAAAEQGHGDDDIAAVRTGFDRES